jgi:hypothetical protein
MYLYAVIIEDTCRVSFRPRIQLHGSSSSNCSGDGEELTYASGTGPKEKTSLSKLYDVMHSENSQLSHEHVIGNIVALVLAGMDTTFKTLAYVLYCSPDGTPKGASGRSYRRRLEGRHFARSVRTLAPLKAIFTISPPHVQRALYHASG